jgi:hypothetical protein
MAKKGNAYFRKNGWILTEQKICCQDLTPFIMNSIRFSRRRSWRDADQLKPTQRPVIRGHGPLALKDMDAHNRLIIRYG